MAGLVLGIINLIIFAGYPLHPLPIAGNYKFPLPRDSLNARFAGNWPFGYPGKVAFDTTRNLAFVGTGGGVYILDFTDPGAPVKLGEIRCRGLVGRIRHLDHILYLTNGWEPGVQLWDISQPAQPAPLTRLPVGPVTDFAIENRLLYIAQNETLLIFDISNPGQPVLRGAYDHHDRIAGIFVRDTLAFLIEDLFTGNTGFTIINIADPSTPYLLGIWRGQVVNGIAVVSGIAYCTTDSGLQIIDISTPANPHRIGSCAPLEVPTLITVRDSFAFVADSGLTVINVRNPTAPFRIASIRPAYYSGFEDMCPADSFILLTQWGKMSIWLVNISNPSAPSELGWYQLPGWTGALAVNGNYAYLADWDYGVRILDISDPEYPVEIAGVATQWGASGIFILDTFAYLAESGCGLGIISIANPAQPSRIGFCRTPGAACYCAVKEGYAYMADGLSGLRIISVADPANPHEVGFWDTPGYAWSVGIQDSLAYVADEDGGLRILNIQHPEQPYEIGSINLANKPVVLTLRDSLVYLGGLEGDMVIVNAADPAHPHLVGWYRTAGPCWGISITYPYAYLADWFPGLFHIVDISDPSNPVQAGYYYTPNAPYTIAYRQPYVYVASGLCGLQIYESLLSGTGEGGNCVQPPEFTLLPNPVRPGAVLDLPAETGEVRLFDSSGRLLKTISFTGHQLPLAGIRPGVYFIQLEPQALRAKLIVR